MVSHTLLERIGQSSKVYECSSRARCPKELCSVLVSTFSTSEMIRKAGPEKLFFQFLFNQIPWVANCTVPYSGCRPRVAV